MKCSLGNSNFLEEISAAAKSLQSCLTLCDPIDSSPPGSSVHGILQARILEWVAISFSLKTSLVFPILLFSSISLHWSLKKTFLSLLAILWKSAFRWIYIFAFLFFLSLVFFSQLFVRPPQTTILPFCISFFGGWSWSLPPVQCH